jgi:glycosyltransferase domain-containing protein
MTLSDAVAGGVLDFTLVIPTYNRPQLLVRLLRYCVGRFPKILVLDSSNADTLAKNRSLINALGEEVELREYDTQICLTQKLLDGLRSVSTPYFSFCADDDIVFPRGVNKALEILRTNPQYVGVDGIYLNFQQGERRVNVGIEYSGSGIAAEHPVARVFHLLHRYESLFYGVFRTQDVLPVFQEFGKQKTLHFQELFQSVGIVLLGRTLRVPIFYAGRQQCEPAEPLRDKWQTYYWFAENRSEFLGHYASYRSALLEFYRKYVKTPPLLSDHDFIQAMDLAHAIFFCKGCPEEYFYGVIQPHCPNDAYKAASENNVLTLLKSPLRNYAEAKTKRILDLIGVGLAAVVFPWHLATLNREVARKHGYSFECVLAKRVAWLAGAAEFRQAYKELCCYLEG